MISPSHYQTPPPSCEWYGCSESITGHFLEKNIVWLEGFQRHQITLLDLVGLLALEVSLTALSVLEFALRLISLGLLFLVSPCSSNLANLRDRIQRSFPDAICFPFIGYVQCIHLCVRLFQYFVNGENKEIFRPTLYDRLKIDPEATESEIKKASFTLLLKFHPDKNSSQEATTISTEITEAYEILSDPALREVYNLEGLKRVNYLQWLKQVYSQQN